MHAKRGASVAVDTRDAIVVDAVANHLEELALLSLQRAALRRVGGCRRSGARTATTTGCATASTAGAASSDGRRGRAVAPGRANVGQLSHEATVERHGVDVVGAREIHFASVSAEDRIRLDVERLREPAHRIVVLIDQIEIAAARDDLRATIR